MSQLSSVFGLQLLIKCVFIGLFLLSLASSLPADSGPSFTIDYDHDTFLKDGKPFRYIAGSIHYFRIPHQYWEDRLRKMKYAGLNAIQVYVAWNVHEPESGVYDFEGQQDLVKFLKLAQEVGLLVVLRPGPYICAEWEYGGLPYWLIRDNATVVIRSIDPQYMDPVKAYLDVLLPKLKPLLYNNGGPIITVQVENEYGSYYTCDHTYTAELRDYFIKHLGSKVILFTTDGDAAYFFKCGPIKGVYATVDFGPGNVTAAFIAQRLVSPKGPLVNSEYYVGGMDHWGSPHSRVSTETAVKTLGEVLSVGANINMYMFEGGTNFGYMNGANYAPYQAQPTSYDYDAPLSEAGDMTHKFYAIKETIAKHTKQPEGRSLVAKLSNSTKKAYGTVNLSPIGKVLDSLPLLTEGKPVVSTFPLNMEKVNQSYGYILYRTTLKYDCDDAILNATGIKDRAYVVVNGALSGILSRTGAQTTKINGQRGETLEIIVENQGRINYGSKMLNNIKGLTQNVTIEDHGVVTDWIIYSLNFSRATKVHSSTGSESGHTCGSESFAPTIYQGSFTVDEIADTFLNTQGWTKGVVFINNFNLGRYWPAVGPQITLYTPAPVLIKGKNWVTMVEFEGCPTGGALTVSLDDTPILNKKTKHVIGGHKIPAHGMTGEKHSVERVSSNLESNSLVSTKFWKRLFWFLLKALTVWF